MLSFSFAVYVDVICVKLGNFECFVFGGVSKFKLNLIYLKSCQLSLPRCKM